MNIPLYQEAIRTLGIESQLTVAIEEMAELTHAICKMRRYPHAKVHVDHVKEEIADCLIILSQLSLHFGTEDIQLIIAVKENRLNRYIDSVKESRPPEALL